MHPYYVGCSQSERCVGFAGAFGATIVYPIDMGTSVIIHEVLSIADHVASQGIF